MVNEKVGDLPLIDIPQIMTSLHEPVAYGLSGWQWGEISLGAVEFLLEVLAAL